MSKINILSANVYTRIAAGEVIERPYSIVKELVENSIDAGATEIEIYVENGGRDLIRVVDNGCGIERDDFHAAFLPHATSKISAAEDLNSIMTLGFRGEAVASIASVSVMTITSKTESGKRYSLTSTGGTLGEIKEVAGASTGTDVRVESLFFNAPVRLKFLKSQKADEADIKTFVSRFILSRSDIAFTYYLDGRKVLQSFGGGEEEAFITVYDVATLSKCFKIDAERNGIRVHGYIGNHDFTKANKSYQSVFLNGRYVLNPTISSAVSGAYSNYLMKRQYPFYVLYIDIPPECVDVNVHPNKSDVRFADNGVIYKNIYSIINAVLEGNAKALEYVVQDDIAPEQAPIVETETKPKQPVSSSISESILKRVEEKTEERVKKDDKRPAVFGFATMTYEEAQKEIRDSAPVLPPKKEIDYTKIKGVIPNEEIGPFTGKLRSPRPYMDKKIPIPKSKNPEKLHKKFPDLYFERSYLVVNDPDGSQAGAPVQSNEPIDYFAENKRYLEELDQKAKQNKIDVVNCTYAGKLFNTYLVYERADELYIIDQHAAHERLIFNRLVDRMKNNRDIRQQPMLVPYEIKLNAFESEFIRERMSDIRDMGLDLQEDGENVFKVHAVPLELQGIDLGRFFNEILGDVSGYRAIKLEDILKDKLASAACKAAVKGGMDLTRDEIDALFALMDGNMGLKCPHGRPVVVKMTKTQLEKMFKRIV